MICSCVHSLQSSCHVLCPREKGQMEGWWRQGGGSKEKCGEAAHRQADTRRYSVLSCKPAVLRVQVEM